MKLVASREDARSNFTILHEKFVSSYLKLLTVNVQKMEGVKYD